MRACICAPVMVGQPRNMVSALAAASVGLAKSPGTRVCDIGVTNTESLSTGATCAHS